MGLFILFICWWYWPTEHLVIVACDVGQGDGTFFQYGFVQMVIDGGPDQKILECLGKHVPIWDRNLEVVLATHGDSDHIGGLVSVLETYKVGLIVAPQYPKKTDAFLAYFAEIKKQAIRGAKITTLSRGSQLQIGQNMVFSVLHPVAETTPSAVVNWFVTETEKTLWAQIRDEQIEKIDLNLTSIVLSLRYKNFNSLFTGDIDETIEKALVTDGLTKDTTLLKAAHHGSKTSSSTLFLESVRPELITISCGKNNTYGHPDQGGLLRMKAVTSHVFRTDQRGDIEIATNGNQYWMP